jgi:hypothetical protein
MLKLPRRSAPGLLPLDQDIQTLGLPFAERRVKLRVRP